METLIAIDRVSHFFGQGALRKQILFEVSESVRAGEIVILTGPSGSGKTTLLTLIGALRSTQEGSLEVLGHELRDASQRRLTDVRKGIGYIFQAHNLLDALTATQNVQMSLTSGKVSSRQDARRRAVETLEAVGLSDHLRHYPSQLSGGQKQRVAIARALAGRPRLILADEPTASLDKKSGRDVVDLMHDLARKHGSAVLLVTHDNRILDIADRIIHLEDGRLASTVEAVTRGATLLLQSLVHENRSGQLVDRLRGLTHRDFVEMLSAMTIEAQRFLETMELLNDDTFESMLEQVIEVATLKIGGLLGADRASAFLVDRAAGELWSLVAQGEGGRPVLIRVPIDAGIIGQVARSGEAMNVPDAYAEPLFNREVDQEFGYRTRSILCAPILTRGGVAFAVIELLNKHGGEPFDASDERRFRDFAASIGPILESWWQMSTRRKAATARAPS